MKFVHYDADKSGIKKLFYDYEFSIPPYQREYSWEKEQWDDLQDLFENLDDADTGFLGQIVNAYDSVEYDRKVNKAQQEGQDDIILSKPVELVDGQQRLTTLTILFHCLLEKVHGDYANEFDRLQASPTIDTQSDIVEGEPVITDLRKNLVNICQWVLRADTAGKPLHERTRLINRKHDILWEVIFSTDTHQQRLDKFKELKEQSDENRAGNIPDGFVLKEGDDNLRKQYNRIHKWLESFSIKIDSATTHDEAHDCNQFAKMFKLIFSTFDDTSTNANRLHVVYLEAKSFKHGVTLFTGINSKGKNLDQTDLIKATMYEIAKSIDSERDVWVDWFKIWDRTASRLAKRDDFSSFLIHHATSIYHPMHNDLDTHIEGKNLSEVYSKIIGEGNQSTAIDNLLSELGLEMPLYKILLEKDAKFTSDQISDADDLESLNSLLDRFKSLHPSNRQHFHFFLFIFRKLRDNELGEDDDGRKFWKFNLNAKQINSILHMHLVWAARYFIMEDKAGTQVRDLFNTILNHLRRRDTLTPDEIVKVIKKYLFYIAEDSTNTEGHNINLAASLRLNTEDAQLRSYFANHNYENDVAGRILWEVNADYMGSELNPPKARYDVDHIAPNDLTKWKDDWRENGDSNDQIRKKSVKLTTFINNVGNRILLFDQKNRSNKNCILSDKKGAIERSAISITALLFQLDAYRNDDWNDESIKLLAEKYCDILLGTEEKPGPWSTHLFKDI